MSTRVGGRYQLVREIGARGKVRVFQAVDMETGRPVAVKVFTDEVNLETLLRFQQEAALLSTLKHPNIVEVYGAFLEEHTSCIVMELLEGRSLAQMLKAERLSLSRIKGIMTQVAAALVYAHSHGIVHRDLTPDNIMVVGDDRVKVTDFALARVFSVGNASSTTTLSGMSSDAPLYLSPEQIESGKVDGRTDIYSFGVILYQMVTGRPPFEGDDPLDIAFKHVHKQPRAPRELDATIPEDWEALILKTLAKDPSDRFQTAAGLAEAVAALSGGDAHAGSPSATSAEPTPSRPIGLPFPRLEPESRPESPPQAAETAPSMVRPESIQAPDMWREPREDPGPVDATLSGLPAMQPEIDQDSPHVHVLDEDVQFTVYRPPAVQPGRWYTMLAFAHKTEAWSDDAGERNDPMEMVREQARAALGEDLERYRTAGADSSAAIARGSELRFVPEVDGIEFNPPSRSFLWMEGVHREDFRLRAAARLNGQVARGRLSVFFGAVLLADVTLSFRVDATASSDDRTAERRPESARPYRKIFASYSHRDLGVVEQVATFARLLGDEFVRDWTHLRSGEQWNERLTDMIREADIFQLFWSANSMISPFVRQEWTYALSLGRQNFIRPVYWEDPLPAVPEQNLPPTELRNLHFQRLEFGAQVQAAQDAGRRCPNCGREVRGRFCTGCGTRMPDIPAPSPVERPASRPRPSPYAGTPGAHEEPPARGMHSYPSQAPEPLVQAVEIMAAEERAGSPLVPILVVIGVLVVVALVVVILMR